LQVLGPPNCFYST